MPEHHGEAFDEYLRLKKINRTKLIKSLGVARGTFYSLLAKRTFDKDELEQVRKETGFVPTRVFGRPVEQTRQPDDFIQQSIQRDAETIQRLEHEVKWHKDNFDKLMTMYERLTASFDRLSGLTHSPTSNIPIPKTITSKK